MQLDFDLIRNTLLAVEKIDDGKEKLLGDIRKEFFSDCDNDKLIYHIEYLLEKDIIRSTMNRGQPMAHNLIKGLSPKGHDIVNLIRDDTVWNETKIKIKPIGTVDFYTMLEIASSVVKSLLNIEK